MAMEVDRLVLRLVADASAYMAVLDGAERRLLFFTSSITTAMAAHATRMATEFERAAIAFEVMTGSAEKGKKLLEDITQLAIATPFHSNELIAAGKQLRAFGFDVEHIMPILENLGEVSAATGTPLERIILAFGQIRASGRLMGQELRQLTNANIPILEHLAKVLNVPMETVRSRIFRGEINFPQVVQAFQLMTQAGGIYAGMMDRVNKETVSGRWEAFTETLMVMSRNFGLAAFEGLRLKDNLRDLTNYITLSKEEQDKAAAGVSQFFDGVRNAAVAVRGMAEELANWYDRNREVVDSTGKFLAGVLAWNLAWRVVQMGTATFGLLRMSVMAALSPVRLLAVGLGLLVLGLNQFEGLTKDKLEGGIKGLIESMSQWVEKNREIVKLILQMTGYLAAAYVTIQAFSMAWAAASTAVWLFYAAFYALTSPVVFVTAAVAALIATLHEIGAFGDTLERVGGVFRKAFAGLAEPLANAFGGIKAALQGGDLEAAGEIAFKALQLAWRTTVMVMKAEWDGFITGISLNIGANADYIGTRLSAKLTYSYEMAKAKVDDSNPKAAEMALAKYQRTMREADAQFARDQNLVSEKTVQRQNAIIASYQFELNNIKRGVEDSATMATGKEKVRDLLGGNALSDLEKIVGKDWLRTTMRGGGEGAGAVIDAVMGKLQVPEAALAAGIGGFAPAVTKDIYRSALKDVLNRMFELQIAVGGVPGISPGETSPEQMAEFVKGTEEAVKKFKALNDALEQTTRITKSRLPVEYQVSSEARMFIDKMNEKVKEGFTPFDTFTRHTKFLDEAYGGFVREVGKDKFDSLGTFGRLFAAARPGNILNDEMYGVYSAQEYEKLHKAIGNPMDKLSPAMVAGSREAADTVIRSSVQSVGLQEEVLTTLRVSKYLHEQFLDRQDKIARILIEMRDGKASGYGPVHSGAGGEFGLGGTWE